jgi:hypothetical protein
MKKFVPLIAICLVTFNLQAQTTLVRADAYLDVRNGKLVEPANILIDGERIKAINPKSTRRILRLLI